MLSPRAPWVVALGPQAPVIVQSAESHGVDPYVALAVARYEGGYANPTKVGDGGTSFGPYQLHENGALPAPLWGHPAAANQWANSPAGIDYAMVRLHAATRGKAGPAAIAAAVREFERPANPNPEIQKDVAFYNSLTHGRVTPPLAGPGTGNPITAGTGTAQGSVANTTGQAGVSGKTVPNIFTNCKITGSGPGGSIPVIGGAVGTFTGIFSGAAEGGMLCYITGVLKISAMAFAGVALMGAGFYLMLPRGQRQQINKATLGSAGAIANLAPGGAAVKSATASTGRRLTPRSSVRGQQRAASTAAASEKAAASAKQTKHREAVQRADLKYKRGRAREATAKAKQAEYKTPKNRMSLSQETEDSITRASHRPRRGRPDRVA